MNRENTITWAREAGLFNQHNEDLLQDKEVMAQFERFAALVAAAERKVIMDSLQKQADLATDALDRRWALEMIAAVAARSSK